MAVTPALVYSDSPGELPARYRLPPGFDISLHSVSAMFDGSGASDDFYPCLSVYSQDNKLIGRFFPAQVLATGDRAEVTFAPFLRGGAVSDEGFIRYDFENTGGWLHITTTTADSEGVASVRFNLDDGTNYEIWGEFNDDIPIFQVSDNGDETLRVFDPFGSDRDDWIMAIDGFAGEVLLQPLSSFEVTTPLSRFDSNVKVNLPTTGSTFEIADASTATLIEAESEGKLGFFGASPTTQPATPVTLGDVIAALQALGLVA